MSAIEIFSSVKKYGPLSNNYKHNMIINKELWNSVTQFVYTNMINNYIYRDNMKKVKIKDIYSTYIKYQKKIEKDIISSSLEEALKVKFENPELLKILLSTGDSDIEYITKNDYLGVGYDNKGDNILGKYLVQLRNEIVNTKIKDENLIQEQYDLYEAFIIYNILKKEMIEEGNDLSDYLYLKSGPKQIFNVHLVSNISDIIKIYLNKNPSYKNDYERQLINQQDKTYFLNRYERKDPELYPLLTYSLRNPSAMILELRKRYLKEIKTNQEIIKYNNVFNIYLEYILQTKYPYIKEEDYQTVINNEFKKQQFIDDPEYIKELNILNEKKRNIENRKNELNELTKKDDLKQVQNSLRKYEKYLLDYKKDIESVEKLQKTLEKLQNKKENLSNELNTIIENTSDNDVEKNTKIRKYKNDIQEIVEKIKKVKDDIANVKIKEKNIKNTEETIENLKIKEKNLLNQSVTTLKPEYYTDAEKLEQIKKYTIELQEIKNTVDMKGNKPEIIKGKLQIAEDKLAKISDFKTKKMQILNKISKIKKDYEDRLRNLTNIYKIRKYDSEEEKEKKMKQLELEIQKLNNLQLEPLNYKKPWKYPGEPLSPVVTQTYNEQIKILETEIEELKDEMDIHKDDKELNIEIEKLKNEIKEYNDKIIVITDKINKIKNIGAVGTEFENLKKIQDIENKIKEDENDILYYEKRLLTYQKIKIYINIDNIKKRLFYVRNQLPPVLKDKINMYLSNLVKIPTDEEINFAETFDLKSYESSFTDLSSDEINTVKSKKVIKIYQGYPSADYISDLQLLKSNNSYQLLSPIYYTGMLRIKNFDYPTVTHYIIANLFANLPIIKKDVDERLIEIERIKSVIDKVYYNLDTITRDRDIKNYNEDLKNDIKNYNEDLKKLNKLYKNKKNDLNRIYEKQTNNVLSFAGNLKEAQQYLLKDPSGKNWNINTPFNWIDYKTLYDNYFNISLYKIDERLKELTIIGLNKKFEDRILQNILLTTENRIIVWNDRKDNILGIGKSINGENFVGKYLMTLRNEIFNQQNLENIEILTEENVTNIIQGDTFMTNWLEMKLKDMCNIVKKVKQYSKLKYDINIENNKLFYNIVLNKILQPCSELFILSNKVTAEVPLYFVKLVNKYIKTKYNPSIIQLLWKRIVVMVYYIIKNVKDPTLYNIKNTLLKVELLVSKEQNCISIIKEDEKANCIFSALINILSGIIEFNKEYNKLKNELVIPTESFYNIQTGEIISIEPKNINTLINKYDFELAISIILNTTNIITLETIKEDKNKKEVEEEVMEPVEEDQDEAVEEIFEYAIQENEDQEQQNEEDKEDQEDENSERESYVSSEDEYGYEEKEGEEEGENDYGNYDGAGTEYKKEILVKEIHEKELDPLEQSDLTNYYKNILSEYLENNNIFDVINYKLGKNNIDKLAQYILDSARLINRYKKISKKIKTNRINFFATIR